MEPTLIIHAALAASLLGTGLMRHSVRQALSETAIARASRAETRDRRAALQHRLWVLACLDHVAYAIQPRGDARLTAAAARLKASLDALLRDDGIGVATRAWLAVRLDTLISETDRFSGARDDTMAASYAATLEDLADVIEAKMRLSDTLPKVSITEQIATLKSNAPRPRRRLSP